MSLYSSKSNKSKDDFITSLITCKICNKIYEDPVILPCHKTICSKHVIDQTNCSIYRCNFCKNFHIIDFFKLTVDEEKIELIKRKNDFVNINTVDFGENNALARDACDLMENVLSEAKTLSKNPLSYIENIFSCIKNDIDLVKEHYVKMIEKNHTCMTNQLYELENECKRNYEYLVNDLAIVVKEAELKLNEWNKILKMPNFNQEPSWKKIRFDAAKQIKIVKDEIDRYQDNLLINKRIEFSQEPILSNYNNILGDLSIKDIEKGNVEIIIKNFSKIETNGHLFKCDPFVINNIPWILEYRMDIKDNIEHLNFFVRTNFDKHDINDDEKKKVIDALVKFKFIQNEARMSGAFKSIKRRKFDRDTPLSYTIVKNKILNPLKGLYDKENDSVTIELSFYYLNKIEK